MKDIGYLIPEFPGQTHIFFWREINSLREKNIEAHVFSTRKPKKHLISHSWADNAVKETKYLWPMNPKDVLAACLGIIKSGPLRSYRCLQIIIKIKDANIKQRLKLLNAIFLGAHLAVLLKTARINHIHVHSCATSADIALFCHILSGITYSITLHGYIYDYGPNQESKWKHSKFAVVITKAILNEVRYILKNNMPKKTIIAPMGVDIRRFLRKINYRPYSGSGAIKIFSCGRLNRCKGHHILLEATKILLQRGYNVDLTIAGGDDSKTGRIYFDYLLKLASDLCIDNYLNLIGAVSEERIIRELEEAHIFALASIKEPLGVAIMEAMAMELPVIATNAGGVPELISDGCNGVTVPPNSATSFADKIEKIAMNPNLATKMGKMARLKIVRSYHSGISAAILAEQLQG